MNIQLKIPPTSLRQEFLQRLASPGKLDFKRYMQSPLRYAGGKSLAVGYVLEKIPDNTTKIVSPFFGGGSVEIACAKELGMEVIGYDIFDILCNYWQVQTNNPQGLYKKLKQFSPNRDTFKAVKAKLNQHWKKERKLRPLELAALYYFNSNTSYGPHFLGWPSDVYLNEIRYSKTLEKVRRFSAPGLEVRCNNFEEAIPAHKSDFLYCDPPYYLEEGRMFVGMYPHRNFPIHHKGFNHEGLRDLLLSHKGGFVLSYNDCPIIRDWYSDCEISTPSWQYTFGQGDTRIGENREAKNGGSHVKKSHELLIWRGPKNGI